VKFRVGRIVYLAFSRDETVIGFAFRKEEGSALVASAPQTFQLPWAVGPPLQLGARAPAAIDQVEMRELVIDAWRMVVPKSVAAGYVESSDST
jgi:hypothetical protein